MGNNKNHVRKNKRQANIWRKIIKTRKPKKTRPTTPKELVTLDDLLINEFNDNQPRINQIFNNRSEFSNDSRGNNKDENFNGQCRHSSSDKDSSRENISFKENEIDLEKVQDNCLFIDLTETPQRTQQTQNIANIGQSYYVLQKSNPNEHTRITRGDFHRGDERFVEISRGKQCLPISVAALCFFKINGNPTTWKTSDINLILINGDAQYNASYKAFKRKHKIQQTGNLLVSELYPYIKIGRNFYYLNAMDDETDSLRVEKNVLKRSNLLISLNRFFNENENQCGIFTCSVYSFAILRKSHSFFLFNSNATSYAGEPMNPSDQNAAACLMEMFTITCLANHLMVASNQGERIFDDSECEPPIFYVIMNLSIEKIVFGKDISARKKINRDLCSAETKKEKAEPKSSLLGVEHAKQMRGRKRKSLCTPSEGVRLNHHESRNISCGFDLGKRIETDNNNGEGENQGTDKVFVGCGMINLGNSCFFNACFQALFHTPILNTHLQIMDTKNCQCMGCKIVTVFRHTHTQENQMPYNPSSLYETFRQKNQDLLNGKQQDAQEFWMRIMNSMERNCCDKLNKQFLHDFVSIVKCENCNTNSQIDHEIYGHVIEIRGRLTIQEAVNAHFAEETLEIYRCKVCPSNSAKKKYFLRSAPNCLCLILNRFGNINEKKYVDNIELTEQLNLSDFFLTNESSHFHYKLVSTINHIGPNILNGHYTATSCYANNLFYEFDDNRVRSINTISGCNAYMLIYELTTKINIQDIYHSEPDQALETQYDEQQIVIEVNIIFKSYV